MESLEDPQKNLTFQDISSEAFSGRFSRVKGRAVILNFTESAWWFRFRLSQNPTNREDRPGRKDSAPKVRNLVLELGKPGIKKIDCISRSAPNARLPGPDSKGWLTKKAGSDRSHIPQDIMFRMTVFKLPDSFATMLILPPDGKQHRFKHERDRPVRRGVHKQGDTGRLRIRRHLWNSHQHDLLQPDHLFVLRDRVYLFYCLYIIGMLIYSSFLYGHVQCLNILPEGAHARLWWFAVWAATFFGLCFCKIVSGYEKERADFKTGYSSFFCFWRRPYRHWP